MVFQATGVRKSCKRFNLPGHAHALTFSCYQRRPFLLSDLARQSLAKAIESATARDYFDLWAYVVMPEHVHMVVWPHAKEYDVSALLKGIKQPVARSVLRHMRDSNPIGLWQFATGEPGRPHRFWQAGGGYDRNISGYETLLRMVAYLHGNPVRRGLARFPTDWTWSSARDWEGAEPGPVSLSLSSFSGSLPRRLELSQLPVASGMMQP